MACRPPRRTARAAPPPRDRLRTRATPSLDAARQDPSPVATFLQPGLSYLIYHHQVNGQHQRGVLRRDLLDHRETTTSGGEMRGRTVLGCAVLAAALTISS